MSSKQSKVIITIIGVGLLAASLLADAIGIGDDPGFGKQQTMGTVAGVVIMFVGLALMKKSS
jgi:hypothetical protein